VLSDRCLSVLSCLSVCDVGAPWPNSWTDHAGRPRPWPHCVTWGPSSPSPKGAQPPNFRPNLLRPNGCIHQNATWYGCRPQPRGLCVRWRSSPPSQKGGGAPKFSARVYCGQTAGWITWHEGRPQPRRLCVRWGPSPLHTKGVEPLPTFRPIFGRPFVKRFALCYRSVVCPDCLSVCLSVTFVHCGQTVERITQVGLGPGHIVLRVDPAPPPPKGHSPQIFGPYLLRPNGCMHQNATWYGCRPQPRGLCVRWRSSPPPPKKGGRAPKFSAHVYCGQTAGWITWHEGRPQPRRLYVRWGPRHTPHKGGGAGSPIFSPLLLWPNGGCIKMPLDMEVGLNPGDFVLDGDPSPLPKRSQSPGAEPPIFGPCLLWPNG